MKSLPKVDEAATKASDALLDLCVDCALSRYPRQRESARDAAYKMFGSFLVEVPLLRKALPARDQARAKPALEEIANNPNHPFKTEKNKGDILAAVALRALIPARGSVS